MTRGKRLTLYVLAGVGLAAVLVFVAVLLLTRTGAGQEQVRRYTVRWLEDRVEGELRIGRLTSEGSILGAVTLHDFSLLDPSGRAFVRADSARLRYDWRTLVGGAVVLDRADLFGGEVVIERLPGWERWNYERTLEGAEEEEREQPGPGSLVLLQELTLHGVDAVVRYPWEPDPGEVVEPGDTARLILEQEAGALMRVMRFEDVRAELPRLLVESPDQEGRLFQFDALSMRAWIWETPLELEHLEGTLTVRDSLLTFQADRVRLPSTRASLVGEVTVGEEEIRMDVRVEGDTVALRDLQWLYPDLPEEGGGSLVFRMQSQGEGNTLWYAERLDIATPGTNLAGSFGIVTGDTLYFTRVNLRASPLDVALLESILPVDLPVEGLLVGTVEVEGPLSALRVRGDMRLAQRVPRAPPPPRGPPAVRVSTGAPARAQATSPTAGSSSMRWSGTFDVSGGGVRVRQVSGDVDRLDPALARALRPGLELPPELSGRVEMRTLPGGVLAVKGLIRRGAAGPAELRMRVEGTVRPGPEPLLDLIVEPDAVPMAALAGGGRLAGVMGGRVRVSGVPSALDVVGEVTTAGGTVRVASTLDLSGADPRYRGVLQLERFAAATLVPALPRTELTGRVQVEGAGLDPATAQLGVRAHLESARVGALDLRSAELRLGLEGGLLRVDTLDALADAGRVTAAGTLGMAPGRTGTLSWTVAADSLGALQAFLFPDTLLLGPDEERARLSGRVHAEGRLSGRLGDLGLQATVRATDLAVDRARTPRADVEVTATGLGSPDAAWSAHLNLQALDGWGVHLTGALVSAEHGPDGGRLSIMAGAGGERGYQLEGRFRRGDGVLDMTLDALQLRSALASWTLAAPVGIRVSDADLHLDPFELVRDGGTGRIHAQGELPRTVAAPHGADFAVLLENVRLGEFLDLAQSDVRAEGTMTGRLEIHGPVEAPRIDADITGSRLGMEGMSLDRAYFVASYADRLLEARVEARHGQRTVLSSTARIPLDLSLAPVERRRLAAAQEVQVRADSLPLALFTSLVRGFQDVRGSMTGELVVGGTPRAPEMSGLFAISGGELAWAATGVRYRGLGGTLTVSGAGRVDIAARALAGPGYADITGAVLLEDPADPGLDLAVAAREFELTRRREVELTGTADLRLTGAYRSPVVAGRATVTAGAVNLDEIWRTYQVVELDDDLLFAVVDTTLVSVRGLVRASRNPFLQNLVVDATVGVGRDVWLRSRQMNVEIAGELDVDLDRRREHLRVGGSLTALRGIYQLYGRRFEVQEGEVEFVGTPGLDPNLRISAFYRARNANNQPLDINATVTGTLLSPRVALTSRAEPPIAESDLVSYLIFGRPTYALGAAEAEAARLGRFGALGLGAVGPSLIGFAGTNLETFAQTLGVVDYLALTADELAAGTGAELGGLGGLLPAARFTLGWYLSDDVFLALSQRVAGGMEVQQPAVRMEWRFRPTWTLEAFSEDRFANTPSLGLQSSLELQRVYGVFLFREWGY